MTDFNEAMFKTKVDNIFVKLCIGIMKQDLNDIKHFLGDDLENLLESKVNEFKIQNKRQMYDEINVKSTRVISRNIENDKEVVIVELISRYMDYVIDMDTGKIICGDSIKRIEKRNILRFEKKLNAKEFGIIRKCPNCGASMSINTTGECSYCRTIFEQDDYDYILVSIDIG